MYTLLLGLVLLSPMGPMTLVNQIHGFSSEAACIATLTQSELYIPNKSDIPKAQSMIMDMQAKCVPTEELPVDARPSRPTKPI